MESEITALSETRKRLEIRIPAEQVDVTIARTALRHQRRAKVPGFRPGKVPLGVVRQRFKQDILHDVANDLVPQAVEEALRAQELIPIDTPDVRDVSIDEGQPLTFHALFEVMPSISDIDYDALTLRRPSVTPDDDAKERTLEQLRLRASTLEPVTDRSIETGDILTVDMKRHRISGPQDTSEQQAEDLRKGVFVEIGATANPPGFDAELIGLSIGESKAFEISYPAEHDQADLAGTVIAYEVEVKENHVRKLPDIDDEFARSVGDFDTVDILKEKIEADLKREAEIEKQRGVRKDLMTQLAARVTVEAPEGLVEREISRRLEQIATQLAQQNVDPRTANIDWNSLRDEQRAPALETVRGTMVLDEVVRRESLTISEEDLEREIKVYAERLEQTPAAVRAKLDRDNGIDALSGGLRREKAIDFLLSHATIVDA